MPYIWDTKRKHRFLVDNEDAVWLGRFRWVSASGGYAVHNFTVAGLRLHLHMHRILMGLSPGDKREVDHINGCPWDNRKENLRICTHAENLRNTRVRSRERELPRGVTRQGKMSWKAAITVNGKTTRLGTFYSIEEASKAYQEASKKLHGEFAPKEEIVKFKECKGCGVSYFGWPLSENSLCSLCEESSEKETS